MTGNKRPSRKTSENASDVLRDKRTSDKSKSAAGYTLGDTPAKRGAKKTGAKKTATKRGS